MLIYAYKIKIDVKIFMEIYNWNFISANFSKATN